MGQLRFVLLGFACVLVLAASAGATPANGKVAFVRDDSSGHAQIWIVNPDGSHEVRVTSDAVDHFDPKWSPDGTELAYTSYPTPGNFSNSDVYVATIDAGGALGTPTQLTTSTSSDTNPAWSPDGTQIAWAHAGNIWVMRADGSGQTQLTHDGFSNFDTEPSWSPSGAEIAYEHQVLNGDYDVRAVSSDGSSNRLIVGTGNFEGAPSWSPDGLTIAYDQATTASSGDDDIYTVPAAGGTGSPLAGAANAGVFETSPSWSPDGGSVIYSSGGNVDIVPAGGGTAVVLDHGAFNTEPSWGTAAPTTTPSAFAVNTTADTSDASPGDGRCADSSGRCSLRAAVQEANVDCNAIVITLPAGTYGLTLGDLKTVCDMSIAGAGARTTTITRSGGPAFRIFEVSAHSLTVSGVSITNGLANGSDAEDNPGVGAGIWIDSSGTLVLDASTVSGNTASVSGGGIDNDGTLTVTRSTISGNSVPGSSFGIGGGIDHFGHSLTVLNSTISGNTAGVHGGGVYSASDATFASDTIAGNSGGGYFRSGLANSQDFTNSVVAENTGGDCNAVPLTSDAHDVSGDGTCNFARSGDPGLGPLQDNGGTTDTQLPSTAAAIDAADDAVCPATDQRGVTRPQGPHCDIGSAEVVPVAPSVSSTASTVHAAPTSVPADGTTTSSITVTLNDAGGGPVAGKTVTLSAQGGSSTVSTVNGTTDTAGRAVFTVKDATAETVTYAARDATDGIDVAQTTDVVFTVVTPTPPPASPPSSSGASAPPPAPPRPAPAVSVQPSSGDTTTVFTFAARGAPGSAYTWDFGDETTAQGSTVTHEYATAGTYAVTVTAIDSTGASATASVSVSVVDRAVLRPVILVRPAQPTRGTVTGFSAGALGREVGSVTWSFGDGGTAHGAAVGHVYRAAGSFRVRMVETDGSGATVSATRTVLVHDRPQLQLLAPTVVRAGTPVAFKGSAVPVGTRGMRAWSWRFGDGSSGAKRSVTHTFSTPGTYTVTLSATDGSGAAVSVVQHVQVISPNAGGAIAARVVKLLQKDTGGAPVGMYLKHAGGAVIAASNETHQFEPASSIKSLVALYGWKQIDEANYALNDDIPLFAGKAEDCPGTQIGTQKLSSALAQMMKVSSNPATLALMQTFGVDALNQYALSLGLTGTSFATHSIGAGASVFTTIGCDSGGATVDGNKTTLADLGTIWEYADPDSNYFSSLVHQELQYSVSGSWEGDLDFTGTLPKLEQMVVDEAPSGVTLGMRRQFDERIVEMAKGGSYGRCLDSACASLKEWLSIAGFVRLPQCLNRRFVHHDYVWGAFVDGATTPHEDKVPTAVENSFGAADVEPLREQVASALAGWADCFQPPANDSFASATVLSGASGSLSYSNAGATVEAGEPQADGLPGGASIWYSWTAPASGLARINLGNLDDGDISVYTGDSVSALTLVGSAAGGYGNGHVDFTASAGTTYRIQLDGYNGVYDSGTLYWDDYG